MSKRRNLETEYLKPFRLVITELNLSEDIVFSGYRPNNRFDPGFDLRDIQRFQYGDLRVELTDRIVIIEVESGGGLTNLIKYWPYASQGDRPIFLLHVFGQGSESDYIAHLRLWDFTWAKTEKVMQSESQTSYYARRFTFRKNNPESLNPAIEEFRRCLTSDLDDLFIRHRSSFGSE